ncbi:MAG: hypothetical protein QM817_12405 [Archangium sp.]
MVDVQLQIRDSERQPVDAQLELAPIPVGRRAMRAGVRLAICWAIALPCVLVPLLHFVLVPGFVLAGVIMAVLAARATVEVTSPSITCPKCTKLTKIEAGTTGWPITIWCSECSTTFFARPR